MKSLSFFEEHGFNPFARLKDLTSYTEGDYFHGHWIDPDDAIDEFEHMVPEAEEISYQEECDMFVATQMNIYMFEQNKSHKNATHKQVWFKTAN